MAVPKSVVRAKKPSAALSIPVRDRRTAAARHPLYHVEFREINAALDALLHIAAPPQIAQQIAREVQSIRKMSAAVQLRDYLRQWALEAGQKSLGLGTRTLEQITRSRMENIVALWPETCRQHPDDLETLSARAWKRPLPMRARWPVIWR